MAGLGEVCTYVAAVLFFPETSTRMNSTSMCTQTRCQWKVPSFQKDISYLLISNIDVTHAKQRHRKQNQPTPNKDDSTEKTSTSLSSVLPPDSSELSVFFKQLSECETKPVVLSVRPEYSDKYIPKSRSPNFPQSLQTLHKSMYVDLAYHELLDACESVHITVTEEMAQVVEEVTRPHS